MAVLVIAALTLRTLAWVSLPPATWFSGDSFTYVSGAVHVGPDAWRPSGYSMLLLLPLRAAHSLATVTAVQHLLGLGVGILSYLLMRRYGLPGWAAALVVAPVLLDAYVVSTEQMVLSESLFTALVVSAVAVLLWRPEPPGVLGCMVAGLLLGLATTTRSVGLPLVALAVLALLVRRAGVMRSAALLLAAALPLGAYTAWYHRSYGRWAMSASGGLFLYGRVSQFVDCDRLGHTTARMHALCPTEPVGARRSESYYVFDPRSPVHRLHLDQQHTDAVAGSFARLVLRRQPADYATQVADRLGRIFAVSERPSEQSYRFDRVVWVPPAFQAAVTRYERGPPNTQPDPRGADALRAYQQVAWVPGVALFGALLLALLGLALGSDTEGRRTRSAIVLLAGSALVLLVVPALTVGPDLRYRLPPLPLLCVATGLAAGALAQRLARPRRLVEVGSGPADDTGPLDITRRLPPIDP